MKLFIKVKTKLVSIAASVTQPMVESRMKTDLLMGFGRKGSSQTEKEDTQIRKDQISAQTPYQNWTRKTIPKLKQDVKRR